MFFLQKCWTILNLYDFTVYIDFYRPTHDPVTHQEMGLDLNVQI